MSVRRSLTFISGSRRGEIGDRDAKRGRALKLTQDIDLPLGILALHRDAARREVLRELLAARRLLDEALVDQLVQQQRLRGDLVGKELALRTQLHQAPQRCRSSR